MQKITMSKVSTPTIEEAFELFLRKCRVKNLTELSIESYKKKMVHFNEFLNGETNLSIITSDTIDDYILWLRENTEANDITINSYLRSVRAFLYYCMDCNYIPTFKIQLIKAEKKIKETYTDEELQRLLVKPDTNNCTFSCYKTWVTTKIKECYFFVTNSSNLVALTAIFSSGSKITTSQMFPS